jgi:uncharacterized membrane protein
MRPLAVLIGIVMGSTVSITVGLLLTGITLLFLPEHLDRIAPESRPLAKAFVLMLALAAASGASFYGELHLRRWRILTHLTLIALLGLTGWLYWPR